MNAPVPILHPNLIRRIFRGVQADAAVVTDHRSAARRAFDARNGVRIDALCNLLADAGLDLSPDACLLVWHMLTAAGDDALRLIDASRDMHGHIPIDAVPKLLIRLGLRPDDSAIAAMIEDAHQGVDDAREAAGRSTAAIVDYRAAIDAPARAMRDPQHAPHAVATMQGLTRTLLDRTLAAENELRATANVMGELRERLVESQREAMADVLTNLPNRRAFDIALADALTTCARDGTPLSIAFCDIDHFKAINDAHGHATGDRVIRKIADMLGHMTGMGCYVARHGGEEFAVLFPHNNASEAFARLDATRAQLADTTLLDRDTAAPIGHVTFSAGIAQYHTGEGSSALLSRADHALYEAKERGRDRISIAPPPD